MMLEGLTLISMISSLQLPRVFSVMVGIKKRREYDSCTLYYYAKMKERRGLKRLIAYLSTKKYYLLMENSFFLCMRNICQM